MSMGLTKLRHFSYFKKGVERFQLQKRIWSKSISSIFSFAFGFENTKFCVLCSKIKSLLINFTERKITRQNVWPPTSGITTMHVTSTGRVTYIWLIIILRKSDYTEQVYMKGERKAGELSVEDVQWSWIEPRVHFDALIIKSDMVETPVQLF